jgi:DNA-binding MarR family transcriptional regulator
MMISQWPDTHADAWLGLLESHKRLTRALDTELEARHGLTLSGFEVLSRLAAGGEHPLRLSAVAAAATLSLSRVSRIVDVLEQRGLVERRPSPEDARAVEAHVTPAGHALVRDAQATHFAAVKQLFLDVLSPGELSTLADVFARLSPGAVAACAGQSPQTAPS